MKPEDKLAVLGTGPIGLSILLVARSAVPCTLYATDPLEERLSVARLCGVHWTCPAREGDIVQQILEREPQGLDNVKAAFDLVVDYQDGVIKAMVHFPEEESVAGTPRPRR